MRALAHGGVSSAVLRADGIDASYGPVSVLRDVSIEVRPGELVGLLGPNGAGKSTLMMALSGHLRVSRGTVYISEQPAARAAHVRARAGVGFVGDDRHIFPSLTAAQTLKLLRSGADHVYTLFPELRSLSRRRVGLMSGGEQQMLAVGRALAASPKVLLIDELSLGLAPVIRERLLRLLRIVADEGTAVLVVEQSARSILEVADRAYVLRRGEIIDHRAACEWHGKLDELSRLFLS
jgi:branched-chain amino acid transport system ATP-binding protein